MYNCRHAIDNNSEVFKDVSLRKTLYDTLKITEDAWFDVGAYMDNIKAFTATIPGTLDSLETNETKGATRLFASIVSAARVHSLKPFYQTVREIHYLAPREGHPVRLTHKHTHTRSSG